MEVKLSVRNLIEFVERSGDIDNSFRDSTRMVEGIRAHQKIQKSYGDNYHSEYSLKNKTVVKDVVFNIEGRADGVIKEGDDFTIDEIKSTTRPLSEISGENKLHWAQAMCYAYFFCVNKELENINISLTYVSVEDYDKKIFKKKFTFDNLYEYYISLLDKYIEFSKIISNNLEKRNKSSKELAFPYMNYRKGQKKMAQAVYKTILDKKKLFVDAPTGTGKTISTIFPAVKAFGEGILDKVFYLTAKSTTKKEALKSLMILKEKNLYIKAVSITSKEKICLNDEVKCNPNDCPFALGHFDRVNKALMDILENEEIMDFDVITSYAEKHRVCPLEFELDISSYADIVICDYNYVFDPNVYLRRFFDDVISSYAFLIDESHNLLERSRSMFSFKITDSSYKELKKYFDPKKDSKIIKSIDEIIDTFENVYDRYGKKLFFSKKDYIDDFDEKLLNLSKKLEVILIKQKDHKNYNEILETYFDINHYIKISDYFTEGFYSTMTFDPDSLEKTFEIKCVDPAKVLEKKYDMARATVFFSATLSPMKFYMEVLGAKDSLKLHLDLPFDENNFMIMNRSLSTRYRDRNKNVLEISDTIHSFINAQKGNYFVFFPSYSYMEDVYDDFKSRYNDDVIIQEKIMDERKRQKFLQSFSYDSQKVGFLVLGGIFSEGVDLKGERLIGTMIISVGMPGVSNERNLIKEYFDEKENLGFDYSYTYPGINKVFQAAGRVIRSEIDRGIIFLIDDRFLWDKYRRLYPRHWKKIIEVKNKKELENTAKQFWKRGEDFEK